MNSHRHRYLAGMLLLAATGFAANAWAQFEEIVVTARKIEENVQTIPISVSPFTAERIRELNLKNLDDIALYTPGLSFTSAFGRQAGSDRATMRGVTTILNGVGNSSAIAYFIDGIYLGGSPQSTELFNLERVEVLRGPQAAQFGRGTYVGAINYVTRKPGKELEGRVELSAGEDGYLQGTLGISGPITENLGYYIGAGYDTFDGQYRNALNNEDLGGEETRNITTKLVWNPAKTVEVIAKFGYTETDDDHFAAYLQPRSLNNCCFRGAPGSGIAPRAREYYVGKAVPDWNNIELDTGILRDAAGFAGVKLERKLASLTINWEALEDVTLTSLTGWVDDEERTAFDTSYGAYDPIPFFAGAFYQVGTNDQTDFSQELRVTVNSIENFRITAGGYYYKGEVEEKESKGVDPVTRQLVDQPFNRFSGFPLTDEEIKNWAIFGGIEWDATERLTLGLEMRYAEDEITVTDTLIDPASVPTPTGCDSRLGGCNETFDSFTPRITAAFKVTEEAMVYLNVAKGTKPGGFNGGTLPDESLRAVDEEEAWNYELGMKSQWLDDRLTVNVAGYFMDISNQQLTTVIDTGGATTSVLENVGETDVWGVELESAFAITEYLSGGLTYAWTDSEIKKRISSDEADLMGWDGTFATLAQFGDVAGRKSPRVPEHMVSLFGRYERPLRDGNSWFITADWAYEDSKFAQEHNLIETGERNIVGLQAGINWGQWEFKVWAKNLFDDDTPIDVLRYIDRRSGTLPSCNSVLGAPPFPTIPQCAGSSTSPRGFALTAPRQRQIGVTINLRFGANR